jgi:DNA-directed RNA polymerase specialized sigma24 family protein
VDGDSRGSLLQESPAKSTGGWFSLEEWALFHELAGELDEKLRLVFEYHYYQGLTMAEIGSLLHITPEAAAKRWQAAKSRIGARLEEIQRASD